MGQKKKPRFSDKAGGQHRAVILERRSPGRGVGRAPREPAPPGVRGRSAGPGGEAARVHRQGRGGGRRLRDPQPGVVRTGVCRTCPRIREEPLGRSRQICAQSPPGAGTTHPLSGGETFGQCPSTRQGGREAGAQKEFASILGPTQPEIKDHT